MTIPRKLPFDDLWSVRTMSNVALSPDGRLVALVMHQVNKVSNETHSVILLQHLDEHGYVVGEPRQLTSSSKNAINPVWAPDSQHLLFLSNREAGKSQLWLIDTADGEAYKLTGMWHGVNEAAWSPDGQWIAFTSAVRSGDADDVLTGRKALDEDAQQRYEEQERFEQFSQLFVMPAPSDNQSADPLSIRRLTSGKFDHLQPLWTPDSQEIGILCNRSESHALSFVLDLWAIDHVTGEARCLTEGTLAIGTYCWSPDGQAAVVVGDNDKINYGRSLPCLYLVTRHGNVGDRMLLLTPDFDKEAITLVPGSQSGLPGPYRPIWSWDGQHIYFLVTQHGNINVSCLNLVWRTLFTVTDDMAINSFLALLPDESGLLLIKASGGHPPELYRLALNGTTGAASEQLTHLYRDASR